MHKPGFPQDDEYTKQAGCCGDFPCDCTANLNLWYPHQYVQNEENANVKSGIVCKYALDKSPLVKRCATGTIYYNQVPLYIFVDMGEEAGLKFSEQTESKSWNEIFPKVTSGSIDYDSGVITLTWSANIPAGRSCLITSYEYSLECRLPKQVECPKCNHKFFDVTSCDDAISLEMLANGGGSLDMY